MLQLEKCKDQLGQWEVRAVAAEAEVRERTVYSKLAKLSLL